MATWLCHVILLIITSNIIPLSPPIAFTYHLVSDGSLFWYTKLYLSIIGNCFSYIVLLKSILAVIPFVGKHTICHYTLLGLISPFPLPSYDYWAVSSKMAID